MHMETSVRSQAHHSPTAQVLVNTNSNGALSQDKIDEQILLLFKKALSDQDL